MDHNFTSGLHSHSVFILYFSIKISIIIIVFLLQDELQMTTKSYEGQLSMMSEHLAAMNEKLTTQKDEIEHLKYQMQNSKVFISTDYNF